MTARNNLNMRTETLAAVATLAAATAADSM